MPNALSGFAGTPPAPNPQPQQPSPQGNALAPQGPPQGAPQQQQAMPPPPSHQQTVAALRHFSAIEKELTGLMKNPDLGKADMKSEVIDGTTKLVANGILTPAAAVTQLATFPDKPFDQRRWVLDHFMQAVQGQTLVLAHHQAGYLGQDHDTTPPSPDDHAPMVAGLMKQYQGAGNAG